MLWLWRRSYSCYSKTKSPPVNWHSDLTGQKHRLCMMCAKIHLQLPAFGFWGSSHLENCIQPISKSFPQYLTEVNKNALGSCENSPTCVHFLGTYLFHYGARSRIDSTTSRIHNLSTTKSHEDQRWNSNGAKQSSPSSTATKVSSLRNKKCYWKSSRNARVFQKQQMD